MKPRRPLARRLFEAWGLSVREDYTPGRINSERSLQASLWSHLVSLLPDTQSVFIESPPLVREGHGEAVVAVGAGLAVCNTRSVIAVVELKFLPRGQPNYEKDIRTLVSLARHRKNVSLRHGRYRGTSRKVVEFGMSENVLFVWAGIHAEEREEPERLYSSRFPSLSGCFLELHAVTRHGDDAKVYSRE